MRTYTRYKIRGNRASVFIRYALHAIRCALILLFFFTFTLAFTSQTYAAPKMADYCYIPPFVTDPNTPPNIMIVFDRTVWGKNRAYQAAYDSTIPYYGFFDSDATSRYKHDGTTFVKDNTCSPATDGNCFPGNVLNYALMSTLDLSRKAFVGFGWTPISSGAGDAYNYSGDLTSYGASNASTASVCNVSFASGTYSYYFIIGADGTGSNKASSVTITVNNTSTCPTSASYWKKPVNNKDISVKYTATSGEDRIGIIQKYSDTDKDLRDDYPNADARFSIKDGRQAEEMTRQQR